MQFKHFVGIDISKLTLDVYIHHKSLHHKFTNDQQGFDALLKWIYLRTMESTPSQIVFCFEHSGFYSLLLAIYMQKHDCNFSMISPLQIKRSLGIVRGKNDKIDSRRIAEYAYEKRDKYYPTKIPCEAILKLHPLMTLRDRLARDRGAFVGTMKEQSKFLPIDQIPVLMESYTHIIKSLDTEIKALEKAIKAIVNDDPELKRTFELITGIKGIGLLVGVYLIIYTHNFSRFETWRKCACFAGIVPFQNSSGTSVRSRSQVHPIANKQIKKMLHIAALSAAHTDKEINIFYNRKIQDGKSKMCVLNIIRNKLLARAFAVARRGTEYVDIMKHVA